MCLLFSSAFIYILSLIIISQIDFDVEWRLIIPCIFRWIFFEISCILLKLFFFYWNNRQKICIEQCIVFNCGASSLPLTSALYLFSCVSVFFSSKVIIQLYWIFVFSLQLFYTFWKETFFFENIYLMCDFYNAFFLHIQLCFVHYIQLMVKSKTNAFFIQNNLKSIVHGTGIEVHSRHY